MSAPAASVVVGVFNRKRQISACVESLLASTTRDFEIVLVDDASTDGTGELLDALHRDHPEPAIRVVHNPVNRGASGGRNAGIDASSGEFVLFTDSDCIVDPAWVERMVAALRAGPDAVSGTVRDKPPTNLAERAYVGSADVIRKTPNLIEGNMGWRRSLAFRLDEALFGGEGDDLAVRMRAQGRVIGLAPDAIVTHHHALDFAGYMRMARQQGAGHARYWYKHDVLLGRDVAAGSLAVLTLPLGLADLRLLALPAALAALQLAALLLNELHYKAKPVREALAVLPMSACFYAVRILTVLWTRARILAGLEPAIVESRRRWRAERSGRPQ